MTPGTIRNSEVILLEKRVWIKSGIVEELDAKQQRLIHLVLEKTQYYYQQLHRTRPCYQHPLSLSRLMKLCNRGGHAVANALRILANTIPAGSHATPPVYYDRAQSQKNKSHRPYRIFLRRKSD
jgi:hypothetical protein